MIALLILVALFVFGLLFIQRAPFGSLPSQKLMEKIKQSPNFKNNQFQNSSPTPSLTDGATLFSAMREFIFEKSKRNKPADVIPAKKTNLYALSADKSVLVWMGHSSYFVQVDGKRILVDPVLSGHASPLSFTTRSFDGADIYTTEEIPEIDFLFLSHDHWDHLDYETVVKLKPKIKKIICGLGVSAHLLRWGFERSRIEEKDWNEKIDLGNGFIVNTTSARHFSGRGFKRNQSLWIAYALKTPTKNIYIGGDSGYDSHFKEIGKLLGPFDLAILECGQYDKNWKHIHMMPEEVVTASLDLQAKRLLAVHWSKFALGRHAWDDPIIRVSKSSREKKVDLLTPMIGEEVDLNNPMAYNAWWQDIN